MPYVFCSSLGCSNMFNQHGHAKQNKSYIEEMTIMTYYYPQDQFLPEFDQRQFGQPGQQGQQFFPGFPGGGGNVNQRLDRLERQIERIDRRIDQLDRRVDRLERRFGMGQGR